jgi:lysophospholipase L1-like esterase
MLFTKQGEFTKKPSDIIDVPSPSWTPNMLREAWETPSNELKQTVNNLVDDLNNGNEFTRNIGDHQGTWHGLKPVQTEVGLAATVESLKENNVFVKDFGAVGDGVADDTQAFNNAISHARSLKASFVVVDDKDYFISGRLNELKDEIILIGKGRIITTNPNNRYFRVFDPRKMSGVLPSVNPSFNINNLAKFGHALRRAKKGGAKVKVTFVGDSLTQGGHRIYDKYWYVKMIERELVETFGDYFEFYNRGWAGRNISDLTTIPNEPISAPYENDWVTSSGVKTWLNYIDDTDPDVVFVAFGTNSLDANVYKSFKDGRGNLKGISTAPDVVWVTSQIRTIDPDAMSGTSEFGTYPNNEYSNNAGLIARLVGERNGDPVIDVNRNASISMLGIDPHQFAFKRWFGQYESTTNKFYGSTSAIQGGDSTAVDLLLAPGNAITSHRLFRNFTMRFYVGGTSIFNPFRIDARKDPNSTSELVLLFFDDRIEYYGLDTDGNFGILDSWTGSCKDKEVVVELVGVTLKVYVNGSGWVINQRNANWSQFLSPITLTAQSTSDVKLYDFYINADEYKTYLPRITTKEVFDSSYGLGGNGLNHPNPTGELELYSQPIQEFVSTLHEVIVASTEKGSFVLASGVTGAFVYSRTGNFVSVVVNDLGGTLAHAALITTIPPELCPQYDTRFVLGVAGSTQSSILLEVRTSGSVYMYGTPQSSTLYTGSTSYTIDL